MCIDDLFCPNEQLLDRLAKDGGFTSIFHHIGCIGDSLSSGEFEGTGASGEKTYHDMFDHSRGQYMARMCGNTVYNFSRGGMTAKEYMESFARVQGYFSPTLACEAYIIALGVNDMHMVADGTLTFGDTDGIDFSAPEQNGKTFVGYYTAILQEYRRIRPDSFFFLMTMPRACDCAPARCALYDRQLLFQLSTMFPRTYVIDLRIYAPCYDDNFKKHFYLGGHLNPMSYVLTAK